MKHFVLGGLAISALLIAAPLSVATAADMPLKAPPPAPLPVYSWTGFYIGLNAGYGWGRTHDDVNYLPDAASFGASPFTASSNMKGGLGGVQAGYNFQINQSVVAGIEADYDAAHISGSPFVAPLSTFGGAPIPGWFHNANQVVEGFGTVRGRLGVLATPQLLLYGTGGLAYGRIATNSFTSFTPAPTFQYSESGSTWKTGWTAGVGAEWAVGGNWSVKAEYLYMRFGSQNLVAFPLAPNAPFAVTNHWTTSTDIFRVGLNYKFGGH